MFNVEKFKKAAAMVRADQYFREKFSGPQPLDPALAMQLTKAGSVEDPELLEIANVYCPESPLEFYENGLGGKFKVAVSPHGVRSAVRLATGTPERFGKFIGKVQKMRSTPASDAALAAAVRRKGWAEEETRAALKKR